MTRFCPVLLLSLVLTIVANAADDWTRQSPALSPSARYAHAMAYIGGDQVMLFGGWDGAFLYDDTWVYDLSADAWAQDANTTQTSPESNIVGEFDFDADIP